MVVGSQISKMCQAQPLTTACCAIPLRLRIAARYDYDVRSNIQAQILWGMLLKDKDNGLSQACQGAVLRCM